MVEAKNKTDPTQDFLRQITEATEATKRAMLLQAKVAENMHLLVPGGGVDEDGNSVDGNAGGALATAALAAGRVASRLCRRAHFDPFPKLLLCVL